MAEALPSHKDAALPSDDIVTAGGPSEEGKGPEGPEYQGKIYHICCMHIN